MTDLTTLLHEAADAAPAPRDLLAGVVRVERRRTRHRRIVAGAASALTVAVVVAGTALWLQPSGRSTGAGALTDGVPPVGTHLPGNPYGVSAGSGNTDLPDTGLGLTQAPAGSVPRRSMAAVYALVLAALPTAGPPPPAKDAHPSIGLALATRSDYRAAPDALVWVARWFSGICLPVGPAEPAGQSRPPAAVCSSWLVMSDSSGQVLAAGDDGEPASPDRASTRPTDLGAVRVPPAGTRLPGDPYGISHGTLQAPTAGLRYINFGLAAPTPGLVPKRTMTQAYALFLAWSHSAGGTGFDGLHPSMTLAMATQSFGKPSHDALVWVLQWPGTCVAAAPASELKRDGVPASYSCTNTSLMSDATKQVFGTWSS